MIKFDKDGFKIALIRSGMTMKQFCSENDFDYINFNISVNGIKSVSEKYKKAIDKLLSKVELINK